MHRYATKTKAVKNALRRYWQKQGKDHSDEKIANVILYNPQYHGQKRPDIIPSGSDIRYIDVLKTERGAILILEPYPIAYIFMVGDTVFVEYCSKGFPYLSFWADKEKSLKDPIPLRKAMSKEKEPFLFATFRHPSFQADWAKKEDCMVMIPNSRLPNRTICVEYPRTKHLSNCKFLPIFSITNANFALNHPDFYILEN